MRKLNKPIKCVEFSSLNRRFTGLPLMIWLWKVKTDFSFQIFLLVKTKKKCFLRHIVRHLVPKALCFQGTKFQDKWYLQWRPQVDERNFISLVTQKAQWFRRGWSGIEPATATLPKQDTALYVAPPPKRFSDLNFWVFWHRRVSPS